MQYYFYFYSTISLISLAVHVIINWRSLVGSRDIASHEGSREFRHFTVALSLFFVTDILWGLLAEWKFVRTLYWDTVVFFLLLAMSIYTWTRYVVKYLEMDGWRRTCLLWAGRGLVAFFAATLTTNHFTGNFFRIDIHNVYATGYMRVVQLLAMILFHVFSAGLELPKMLRAEGAFRRRNLMVLTFSLTTIVAVVLQLCDPLLPFYSMGYLFGCCLLHVFVFEDERDELLRKEMLSREYKARFDAERAANQSKSLFFSTVSHDIRTPLNAIIGYSELLEQGVGDPDERERYISSIRSSGKVLARLVNDILDISKIESGKLDIIKEPTDVPALIREVIASCEVSIARKSLALKSDIDKMPCVSVDPQRIRQILFNLLSNACKYTDKGTISVRVAWNDGTLEISVSDTGKGISKDDISRIFKPFVQLVDKNHRDGTGLGLPICHKLAYLMDGDLSVSSEVGVGSTFSVTLHNVDTAEPPQKRSERNHGNRIHSPSSILVVDDSPVNRAVLKAMLAKCGVSDVTLAGNGREALDILKSGKPFDFVLTDLWMPEMDGSELVHAIRSDKTLAPLPVYLLTADGEARKQAGTDGFTGIFLKPITLDRLISLFA